MTLKGSEKEKTGGEGQQGVPGVPCIANSKTGDLLQEHLTAMKEMGEARPRHVDPKMRLDVQELKKAKAAAKEAEMLRTAERGRWSVLDGFGQDQGGASRSSRQSS